MEDGDAEENRVTSNTSMTSETTVTSPLCSWRFWLLTASGMFIMMLTSADYSVYGLIYLELQAAFSVSSFSLGWLNSIFCIAGFFTGIAGPPMIQGFGYRAVSLIFVTVSVLGYALCCFTPEFYSIYLFYGVVAGFGISMLDMMEITLIQENIHTNRVFATAIVTSGNAVGSFVWPYLYEASVVTFSWRGAFLTIAAVTAQTMVLSMVQTSHVFNLVSHPKKEENNDTEEKTSPESKPSLLAKTRLYFTDMSTRDTALSSAMFLHILGDSFNHYMIAIRMDYVGLTKSDIVFVMAVSGGVGLLRFLPCYLIDRFNLNRTKVAASVGLLIGVITMVSVTFTSFGAILVFFIVWGILRAVHESTTTTVFVDVFGRDRVHKAMGVRVMVASIAIIISLPLSGILLDMFHDVTLTILLFGGSQVIAAILVFWIAYSTKLVHLSPQIES